MATLKDILEIEKSREDISKVRVIHLFQEGNFLRAYEVSCWLFHRFVNDKYVISCKHYKSVKDPVCLLGFPPASLDKMLASDKCKGIGYNKVDDYRIDLLISAEMIPDECPLDLLHSDYVRWKGELKVESSSPDSGTVTRSNVTVTSVLQEILAYPLERKSPLDAYSFLVDIRTKVASIF